MAITVTYDTLNRYLLLDQVAPDIDDVVTLDVGRDIYSDAKRQWLSNVALFKLAFPFNAVGGFDIGGGVYSGTDYFLSNDVWKIVPYDASHQLSLEGNLRGTNPTASLFISPSGSNTIAIIYERSSLTQRVDTTPAQRELIADAVWDEQLTTHTTAGSAGEALSYVSESNAQISASIITTESIADGVWMEELGAYPSGTAGYALNTVSASSGATPADIAQAVWTDTTSSYAGSLGTFGDTLGTQVPFDIQLILSLAGKRNFRLTDPTYDANGLLLTVTINSFANSADASANTNPTAQLAVSASYDGSNNLSDYVVLNL